MLSIDLPNSNFDRELEQIQTVQLIAFQSDLWANSKQLEGSKYTNSLVNADSFYANFTNMTFQKIPIPHLTRSMKQKILH